MEDLNTKEPFSVKRRLYLDEQLAISNAFGRFYNSMAIPGHYIYAHANFMELTRTLKQVYKVKELEDVVQFELFLTDEKVLFIISGKGKPEPKNFTPNPDVYTEIKDIVNPYDLLNSRKKSGNKRRRKLI